MAATQAPGCTAGLTRPPTTCTSTATTSMSTNSTRAARRCHMARCTAPVRGHRSASAAADCPACGGRYGRYSSYGSYSSPSYSSSGSSGVGRSSGGGSGSGARPRWSRAGSSLVYTPAEVRALTPVRDSVERRPLLPELRDVFCSSHSVSGSGSARRTSPSARRCSAKSTGVWRGRESGSCW
jgi:hypothetical protein